MYFILMLLRGATIWKPTLRGMSYEDEIQKIEMTTLDERRKRCHVIMLFICITGRIKLDKDGIILNTRRTRGHSKKLKVNRGDKNVKKFNFSHIQGTISQTTWCVSKITLNITHPHV